MICATVARKKFNNIFCCFFFFYHEVFAQVLNFSVEILNSNVQETIV